MPLERVDRPLEVALVALRDALDATGALWMVIGGIAVITRGVRRMTTDIDATIVGDALSPEALLGVLAHHGFVPRMPDAAIFAAQNLVLLVRHQISSVEVDLSFAWSGFELEALAGRDQATFGSVRVPMATPSALVVYKAVAGRPRDRDDLEALLVLHSIDLVAARRKVAELAELAEAPEMLAVFDDAVARSGRPTSSGSR